MNGMDNLLRLWFSRSDRERVLLGVMAALIGVLAGYAVFWQPAETHVRQLEKELPSMRSELSVMQGIAAELSSRHGVASAGNPAPLTVQPLDAVVTQSLKEAGIEAQSVTLGSDGRVRVECRQVPFSTMADWLDQMRKKWQVALQEGRFERTTASGQVKATLVLRRGG
jgi:general secretion pathway protein M